MTSQAGRVIANRLMRLRERAGQSQQDLADATGMSQPTYSRIESGERPLKGGEAIQLADALGVRVGAILGAAEIDQRALCAARTEGGTSEMATMRLRLAAYLELDAYLEGHGVASLP